MKLSDKQYTAGVKSMMGMIDGLVEAWKGNFCSTMKVKVYVSKHAVDAALADLDRVIAENPEGVADGIIITNTNEGRCIEFNGITVCPSEHEDVMMGKSLAAWVIDIAEEQALIEAVPHRVDEMGVFHPEEETVELNEALDACVLRAHKHQEGLPMQVALANRKRATTLFDDKEHWEEIVMNARAALAEEVA